MLEKKIEKLIEEALHANHPLLNKLNMTDTVKQNRSNLAKEISNQRQMRDENRGFDNNIANARDNLARFASSTGNVKANYNTLLDNVTQTAHQEITKNQNPISRFFSDNQQKAVKMAEKTINTPRSISSAKE